MKSSSRLAYVFLCVIPFVIIGVCAPRALRVSGVYQTIGAVILAAIVAAAWKASGGGGSSPMARRCALAGALLLAPLSAISLLWVGLGTPWQATAQENVMRYVVLLFGSVAVTGGFIVLKELLRDAGEHLYSALGYTQAVLAGAMYSFWTAFQVGAYLARVTQGQVPPAVVQMANVYDTLLFAACVLTYGATAAFAASLSTVGWLGRAASRTYIAISILAFVLISMRGFSFPDPGRSSEPWYFQPAFIAGIPAVPWLMPFLLGVSLLRNAGDKRDSAAA